MEKHSLVPPSEFADDDLTADQTSQKKSKLGLTGSRNAYTFGVSLFLWALISYFIVAQSLVNEDPFVYVQGTPGMYHELTESTVSVAFTEPAIVDCTDATSCLQKLDKLPLTSLRSFHDQPPDLSGSFKPGDWRRTLVTFTIDPDHFKTKYTGNMAALNFPRMRFQQAELFLGETHERRFFSGERMLISMDSQWLKGPIVAKIILYQTIDDAAMFVNWAEPAFLTDMVGLALYQDFISKRENRPARQISSIIQVSMAAFSLILFLIVESSNEALGLALFMGFHALSMAFGLNDLKQTWLPTAFNASFLEYFCHAMGDVFRLFFFLSLARVRKHNAGQWFLGGALYAVPYALLLYLTLDSGWTWQRYLVGTSEGLVALTGCIVCSTQLWALRSQNKPWRIASLTVACVAAIFQLAAIFWNYPLEFGLLFHANPAIGNVIAAAHTNGAYLLALSMFINISTLENRVRALSRERARAQTIERELELGRSVQQAFMTHPILPPCIEAESYHEAALYVSGDTYYLHWNEEKNRFVCLLTDVTGHGVQAALKAFGCTVIARSLWRNLREDQLDGDRRGNERLSRYNEAITSLITTDGNRQDLNAMLGAELDVVTGVARLYRVNYNYPFVVSPTTDETGRKIWEAKLIAIANQTVTLCTLLPESLVVLVSDGILAHPRDQKNMLRYMNQKLRDLPEPAKSSIIKQMVLDWANAREARIIDDKTLLVFQWIPDAMPVRQSA